MGIQDWIEKHLEEHQNLKETYEKARREYSHSHWLHAYLASKHEYFFELGERQSERFQITRAIAGVKETLTRKQEALDTAEAAYLQSKKTLSRRIQLAQDKIKGIRDNKL